MKNNLSITVSNIKKQGWNINRNNIFVRTSYSLNTTNNYEIPYLRQTPKRLRYP